MPRAPSGMVPAQICGDRQQPGGKLVFEVKLASILIHSDECFLGKFDRVRVVTDISQDERKQRLLPAVHQLIQSRVVPIYQTGHAREIWIVVFRHSNETSRKKNPGGDLIA